jgi:hypothetical protein
MDIGGLLALHNTWKRVLKVKRESSIYIEEIKQRLPHRGSIKATYNQAHINKLHSSFNVCSQ